MNLTSELVYISYAHNRDLGMTPEQLNKIGFSIKYEVRYQMEKQYGLKTTEQNQFTFLTLEKRRN